MTGTINLSPHVVNRQKDIESQNMVSFL